MAKNTIQSVLFEEWSSFDKFYSKREISFVRFRCHLVFLSHLAHLSGKHLVLLLEVPDSAGLDTWDRLRKQMLRGNGLIEPLIFRLFPQRRIPRNVCLWSVGGVAGSWKFDLRCLCTHFRVDWTLRSITSLNLISLILVIFLRSFGQQYTVSWLVDCLFSAIEVLLALDL